MDPIDARPLAVGDRPHGFCGGFFGRDHYDCCTVEAIGWDRDWVVVRNDDGSIGFASSRGDLAALRKYRKPTTDGYDQPCCQEAA